MTIDTKSMQGFVTYMQGRAVGNSTKFHVEEKGGCLVMDLIEDNGITISISFLDEERVLFIYENETAYLAKTVDTMGGFISAMIEFTQKNDEHFRDIIEHIDDNPITYKPYTVYYKTVETTGLSVSQMVKEGE